MNSLYLSIARPLLSNNNIYLPITMALVLAACAGKPYQPEKFAEVDTSKRVRVSVIDFKNKSASTDPDHCHGWLWFNTSSLGSAFEELTVDELSQYPNKFTVLERTSIQELKSKETYLNQGDELRARSGFNQAEYSIAGSVDTFEYCNGRTAASVGVSFLSLRGNQESATVGVNLRLIHVPSGRVVATARGVGNQSRNSLGAGITTQDVSLSSGAFRQSTLADAIREAIHRGMNELLTKAKI
jgi:curli biogenesis system outer membrane secretion channel CsgG